MSRAEVEAGKRFERQIAQATGGRRVIRSSYGGTAPDIEHPVFVGECKLSRA